VLYSDEAALIGQTFSFEDEARTALTAPRTEAGISDLSRPENRFERGEGRLLEVYRPVWTPQGRPLLFETYFRYTTVSERTGQLWRAFAGLMLSSILVLFLLLIPLVWSLVRRTRTAQREREAMLQRAVDASGQERARIAASLHDGIVSQLAGTSFDIAARAERARAAGEPDHAGELGDVAAAVRTSIGGLRALLVEIYPPSLTAAGLRTALRDLANASGADARVELEIDEDVARALHPDASDAVFRVVREGLRNAEKHAGASTIWVRLAPGPESDGSVRLDLEDDGIGFDAAEVREYPGTGHFGLLLIADAARSVGARLRLRTGPGEGTHYRMDIAVS
jgi:signal transduction histidine kinase